jgi:ornithine decarboxylase
MINKDFINEIIKKNNLDDSPFYIIDLNIIKKLYNNWIEKLPNIKPFFAIKCNPNEKIIKLLGDLGCNFDCASKSEIELILNIIKDPNRIIYANPCKSCSYIKYANDNNVKLFTFDCEEELYKIKENCQDAKVILRLEVDDTSSLCKFNYKFGCKLKNIHNIFKTINDLNINLVGFSFHVGSGCKDANSYYKALEKCRFAYDIAKNKYNITPYIIDIGGGFPGTNNENKISFDDIVDKIKKGQNDFFGDINNIEYIAEPGRYFTEASHTLFVTVTSKKKENNHFKYYINDGIYGSFNCITNDHQNPIFIPLIQNINNNKLYISTVFGPTCDSIDTIYKDILLPELNINDILYIENFGSYTISASAFFNGFKTTNFIYL